MSYSISPDARRLSRLVVALLTLGVACGDNLHPAGSDGGNSDGRMSDGMIDGSNPQQAPMVTFTAPSSGSDGVAINVRVAVAFDLPMMALTGSTFTLSEGATAVTGVVTNSTDGLSATFTPSANLAPNATFTAMITTGAQSAAGTALAANYTWMFSTGAAADTTAPTVTSTNPATAGTGAPINSNVIATFSEAIDPATVTSTTFTLAQGVTTIAGAVSVSGTNARFNPTASLSPGTVYTATLTTGVKDLQGNAMLLPYTWTFTTGTTAAMGPAPVGLGTAANYTILAKTAISSVPQSMITGDIAVSPAAATFITGFDLMLDATTTFSTATQVVGGGRVYAASYTTPTPTLLTVAVSNMEGAYTDAAGRSNPNFLELGSGNIGGLTLVPGLYKWTSNITVPSNVTISGGANDTWIFQTTGNLTMSANMRVNLAGQAQAKNIVWQVAGTASTGAGAHFEGILLCKTQVTLQTGTTMNGRVLAQTLVALQSATVTPPAQ
jgi:Ice-binding-like/Bacterial Ig-like domain